MKIGISGTSFVRDTNSMALINKDRNGLNDYIKKANEGCVLLVKNSPDFGNRYIGRLEEEREIFDHATFNLPEGSNNGYTAFYKKKDKETLDFFKETFTTYYFNKNKNRLESRLEGIDPEDDKIYISRDQYDCCVNKTLKVNNYSHLTPRREERFKKRGYKYE